MAPQIALAELADFLHASGARWKAMAMLRAYFDESGTCGQVPSVVIAGYVGDAETWGEVEARWLPILEPYRSLGVSWFHMVEAVAQRGQFSRVEKPHINYLITQLASLLGHPRLQPIFSSVIANDWDALDASPAFRARFPKPYDLCFEDVVITLRDWAKDHAEGELVAPVFAFQPEASDRNSSAALRYAAQPWYLNILGTIGFDCPQRLFPLQGADLLAHQMGWDVERRVYDPMAGPTRALHDATGGRFAFGHIWDAERLRLAAANYEEKGLIYTPE
jgi:hypothetical protein